MIPRVLSLGDRAFTIEFADGFDDAARAAIMRLDSAIARVRADGKLCAIVDIAPTFRSLTVHFDPATTTRATLEPQVLALVGAEDDTSAAKAALWRLPVLYGGAQGPDLQELAEAASLSVEAAIALHSETEVRVHMLGFLPGFAFMGDIAEPLRRPRRAEPRVRVPAGSVAVADRLTAVYPWESPGGWHLIGLCPVPFFDSSRSSPALMAPGDRVRFESIDTARFDEVSKALAAGMLAPEAFRSDG